MSFFRVKPWSRAGAFARGRGEAAPRVPKVGDTAVHSAMAWKPEWGGQMRLSSEKKMPTAGHVFSTRLSNFWGHSANLWGFDGGYLMWQNVLLWFWSKVPSHPHDRYARLLVILPFLTWHKYSLFLRNMWCYQIRKVVGIASNLFYLPLQNAVS